MLMLFQENLLWQMLNRQVSHLILMSYNQNFIGVNCPAITAYFDGTLQDPNNRDFSITASFGLKLEANKNDKKIHISTPKFNLTKPDIPGGFFNYFYNGGDTRFV